MCWLGDDVNSQILCCCSDQSTALHVAAREGQVAAVRLLLQRGAEISLNKRHASFFHEALQHRRKDVVNAIIDSDRFDQSCGLRVAKLPKSPRFWFLVGIFQNVSSGHHRQWQVSSFLELGGSKQVIYSPPTNISGTPTDLGKVTGILQPKSSRSLTLLCHD